MHPTLHIQILEVLLNIGYDLDQQSGRGPTPLLFMARQYKPQTIRCLRLFIERGANRHITDPNGQAMLHLALAAPGIYKDWSGMLHYPHPHADDPNFRNREAHYSYNILCDYHEEDYDDKGLDPGPLLNDGSADEYSIDYILCEIKKGFRKEIRHPVQVLKKRARFKILYLLQAGCDPNVVDHEGLSPSDYARRDGFWPQWTWALLNAGYFHHERDGWVKRSLFEGDGPSGRIDGGFLIGSHPSRNWLFSGSRRSY